MLPGDKYHILQSIIETNTTFEQNIPWRRIAEHNKDSRWSTTDRKAAFEHMKQCVGKQNSLKDLPIFLEFHFVTEYANELNRFYDPVVAKAAKAERKKARKRKAAGRQDVKLSSRKEGGEYPAAVSGPATKLYTKEHAI